MGQNAEARSVQSHPRSPKQTLEAAKVRTSVPLSCRRAAPAATLQRTFLIPRIDRLANPVQDTVCSVRVEWGAPDVSPVALPGTSPKHCSRDGSMITCSKKLRLGREMTQHETRNQCVLRAVLAGAACLRPTSAWLPHSGTAARRYMRPHDCSRISMCSICALIPKRRRATVGCLPACDQRRGRVSIKLSAHGVSDRARVMLAVCPAQCFSRNVTRRHAQAASKTRLCVPAAAPHPAHGRLHPYSQQHDAHC